MVTPIRLWKSTPQSRQGITPIRLWGKKDEEDEPQGDRVLPPQAQPTISVAEPQQSQRVSVAEPVLNQKVSVAEPTPIPKVDVIKPESKQTVIEPVRLWKDQYNLMSTANLIKLNKSVSIGKQEDVKRAFADRWAKQAQSRYGVDISPELSEMAGVSLEQPVEKDLGDQNIFDLNRIYANEKVAEKVYDFALEGSNRSFTFLEGLEEGAKIALLEPEKLVPFAGSVASLQEMTQVMSVANKVENNEELSALEKSLLSKYQALNMPTQKGIGYSVGSMLIQMPTYMAEFALTAGIFSGAKTAVTNVIGKSLASRFVATVLAGGVQSLANVPRISSLTAEYLLPNYEQLDSPLYQRAESELKDKSFLKALTQAIGTNAVEYITERAGVMAEKPVAMFKKAFLSKWIAKYGLDLSSDAVGKLVNRIGWNGVIGEVFEEEIGEPFQQWIMGEEYNNFVTTPAGQERLLTEILGIGAFGGMSGISVTALQQGSKVAEKATLKIEDIAKFVASGEAFEDQRGFAKIPFVKDEKVDESLFDKDITRPKSMVEKDLAEAKRSLKIMEEIPEVELEDSDKTAIERLKQSIIDKTQELKERFGIEKETETKPEKPSETTPLVEEAKKAIAEGKTAEEFVGSVKKEPLDVGIDRKNLSEAHRIGESDEYIIGKKTGKSVDEKISIVDESGKKVSERIEKKPEFEYRLVSFDKNIDDNLYNAFLRSEKIVTLEEAKSQLTDIFNQAQEKAEVKKEPIKKKEPTKKITKAEPTLLKERIRRKAKEAKVEVRVKAKEVKTKVKAKEVLRTEKRKSELQKLKQRILDREKIRKSKATFNEKLATLKEQKLDIESMKATAIDYLQFLPREESGKLLVRINKIKTEGNLNDVIQDIGKLSEKVDLRRAISKLKKDIKKLDLRKLRPERKANIEEVLENLDLAKATERTKQKLLSRLHYIEENPDNLIPPEKIAELKRLNRKSLSDLTVEDINLIGDTIKHEVKLNELKNKLIFGKDLRKAREVIDQARVNINSKEVAIKEDPNLIDSSKQEPKSGKLKQIFTIDSYNPELITEILDRKKHGIVKEVLYGGIDEGTTEMLKNQQEAKDWLNEQLEGIDVNRWSSHFQKKEKNVIFVKIKLPDGRRIKLTKGDIVSFILHSKNTKNSKHLLKGGFRFDSNLARKYKLTRDDLDAIIDSASEEEKKVADIFHEFLNTIQKDKLNETSVALNGWEIATEPDYYPIRTVALDRKRDALKLQKNLPQASLEGMGVLKERTNSKNALVIEDAFKVIYSHLKKTSSYVGLAKPLRNAKMLLFDQKIQQDIRRVYGQEYYQALIDYIKAIEDNAYNTSNVEKLVTDWLNKLDIAILGLNPFVMAKQPVSYLMASTEMEIKYLKSALKTKVNVKEISKWSPQLRDRLEGNVTRELGELGQVGAVRTFFTGKHALSSSFMAGIRKFDYATVGRIWNAVKLEIRDKNPELQGDAYMEAVTARAEEVIRLTQPTFMMKDRSNIGRDQRLFVRLLTKYTSQRNKNYNAIRRAILEYDIGKKTKKDKTRLLYKLAIITVISSLMIMGIDELRNLLYRRKNQGIISRIIKVFGNTLSFAYGIGDIFSSLISKVERGTYGGWDMSNPVSSFADNALDGMADLMRAVKQASSDERYKSGTKKGEAKWKTSALRGADQAIDTIAKFKGIPYATIKKLIQIPFRYAEDEEPTKTTGRPKPPKLPTPPRPPRP